MQKIKVIILLSICLLSFAACGSVSRDEATGGLYGTNSIQSAGGYATASESSSDMSYAPAITSDSQRANYDTIPQEKYSVENNGNFPAEDTRKIIRNASMSIEAEDASKLYESLTAYCKMLGGYEFSSERSNYDTYTAVTAVFKIPPQELTVFMNYAGENGKIINSKVNSNDVTDDYYDMKIRVETKRKSLERYYSLLENAGTMEDIVYLQRVIDGITEDIEAFEGRLRVLDNLVDMATVSLYISQEEDPVLIERREIDWNALSADDMGYFIKSGFISVINVIASVLQWIVITLIVVLPVWLPVVIIINIVLRRRKIKKAGGKIVVENTNTAANQNESEIPKNEINQDGD